MTFAAERRDLFEAGGAPAEAGAAFPPLKRRIRPIGPGRAAKLWLARFRILARPPDGAGVGTGESGTGAGKDRETDAGSGDGTDGKTNDGGDSDVADVSAKKGPQTPAGTRARAPGGRHERKAA